MPPSLILMYHRVSDDPRDPWSLRVSPSRFEEHLQVLSSRWHAVPLQELAAGARSGELPERSVAVTFDDGYADNLTVATPLLERHQVPATVFATIEPLTDGSWFWWDVVESLFLDPGELPELLEVELPTGVHRWLLGPASTYDADAAARDVAWRAGERPPSMRHSTFVGLSAVLRAIGFQGRRHACRSLERWVGRPLPTPDSRRPLTVEELEQLAASPMVEIGAHTVHHLSLPAVSPQVRRDEVEASRAWLEQHLGRAVRTFAYPYGHVNPATVDAVRAAGLEVACTVVEEPVNGRHGPLELPRLGVENWDGEEFERRLEAALAQG